MKNFARGIFLKHNKRKTQDKHIEESKIPARVAIPLQQNLGCAAEPIVKIGEYVVEGQKIGDSSKFVFAPIHASISGKVTKIEYFPNACGFNVPSVVIESSNDTQIRNLEPHKPKSIEELTPEEIRGIVREAGIVGLGGATFPTHVKLTPPPEKKIEAVIINGCECEPYITVDHRLMVERPSDIVFGASAIAKAVRAKKVYFAIEKNKPDAILAIKEKISKIENFELVVLDTKYPQGGEKMLIKSVLNKEVPSHGLPMDVSVVVNNVYTAIAITEAIKEGKPLTKRALTVTGSGIKTPKNLYVRIGTPFSEVIEECGGFTEDVVKVVMGGPMTGLSVSSMEVSVVKGTSCILVLNKRDAKSYIEKDCIRCGRCIKACPTGLAPNFLADYIKLKDWDRVSGYNVADCIECGCCGYVCPSRICLVQYFKLAKKELQTRKAVCQ